MYGVMTSVTYLPTTTTSHTDKEATTYSNSVLVLLSTMLTHYLGGEQHIQKIIISTRDT
jgi:hypothetical protein